VLNLSWQTFLASEQTLPRSLVEKNPTQDSFLSLYFDSQQQRRRDAADAADTIFEVLNEIGPALYFTTT